MSEQQHTTHRQHEVPWWVHFCRWLWKCAGFLGTSVILALVVNVVSTWLTTSKGALPDDAPFHLLVVFWPITVSVSCSLLLLAVLFWVISQRATPTSETLLPITPQERTRLVRRLLSRYDQMLQQSLQGAVQIELGLMPRPTAIQNSALLALRLEEQADQVLPAHTSIVDVYERANQELLILGEPGAGKSALLLELAHALVAQADQDATSPLPVLLPLSTWVTKQPPLQDWLIEQFALLYDVPRTLSRQWIEAKLVLPLLDGLDEMDEAARPACVVAINTYHREHLSPLVVCSRTGSVAKNLKLSKLKRTRTSLVRKRCRTCTFSLWQCFLCRHYPLHFLSSIFFATLPRTIVSSCRSALRPGTIFAVKTTLHSKHNSSVLPCHFSPNRLFLRTMLSLIQ